MQSSTSHSPASNDLTKSIAFFSGAEMPARVWSRKYRLRDKADNYLEDSPLQTFCRMADAVNAPADSTIRHSLVERRFIPAGRVLFALGNPYYRATLKNCLTGDTMVLTNEGWQRLDEIASRGEERSAVRIDGETKSAHAWSNGVKKIVEITTKEGYTAKSTPDHRFRLEDGTWKVASALEPGDLVDLGHDDGRLREGRAADGPANEKHYVYGYAAGLFVGDGTFAGDGFKVANVRLFGQKAHVPINLIAGIFGGQPIIHEDHVSYNNTAWANYMDDRLGIRRGSKTVTDQVMSHTSVFQTGFLRGFFDADGCVTFKRKKNSEGILCTTRGIRLGQSDLGCIRRVQTMLLGFGIKSKIYKNGEAGPRDFGVRGTYVCKAAWVLNITRESFRVFVEKIGFSHPDKAAIAASAVAYGKFKRENWFARVKTVEDAGEAEVFDMSVDDTHAFIAGGLIAHNCYVLGLREDSLEAISDLRKDMARTYAMGGGVGIDLSVLRPAGAPVKNCSITSSGAASFADGFSHLTGEIGQNGRRGALMISMTVDHPDIERFVRSKNDFNHDLASQIREKLPRALYKKLNEEVIEPRRACANANMSVRITDRFMKAVKNGKHHITRFVMDNGEVIEKVYDAKDLFRKIVEGAWSHGCPGCLFWDTMTRDDNRNYLDARWHIITTNPCGEQPLSDGGSCLHPNTLLTTSDGLRRIETFNKGVIATASGTKRPDGNNYGAEIAQQAIAFKTDSNRPIVKVTIDGGMVLRTTPDHIFMTDLGEVRADKLVEKDAKVRWMNSNPLLTPVDLSTSADIEVPLMLGWMHGDGWMTESSIGISFNAEDGDFDVKDRILKTYYSCFGERKPLKNDGVSFQVQTETKAAYEVIEQYGVHLEKAGRRRLPRSFFTMPINQQLAFLAGIFTADGWVQGKNNAQIGYSSSSPVLVEEVQQVLGALGIQSRLYSTDFDSGRNTQYRVAITKASARRFMDYIGFITTKKQTDFNWEGARFSDKEWLPVLRVEDDGTSDVYDFTVPTTHTGFANGVLVHNCNLGAINLARFTKNAYTSKAEFDWEGFKQAIRDGVRFLDEVNTIELEENRAPIPKQAEVTAGLRQIGLGVMGYGDLLLQHQIKYASDDAMGFTDKLFRVFRDTAYHESIMLAKELGSFPAFDWDKIKRSPFIDRLPAELKKLMKEHGLRNSNVLSIAPTGTISMLGETTGGVEPEFAFQLTRACMLGDGKRTKFTFLTPTAQRIAKALGKSIPQGEIEGNVDMSWLPEWAVASHQIDPKRRAKVQGLIQNYIDTAISSTVNLPETATIEDVMEVYWTAYEAGCKGVTVYREGSREGILQTLQEEERLEYPIEPPLQINSRRLSFKGERGLQRILINVGDYRPGVPCEVSIIHGKSGTEVASYASALGIVTSIALQNGVHPIKLARAMEGISAGWATRIPLDGKGKKPTTLQSVPDAVAAALRKFYGNGIYEKGLAGKPINGETNQSGWELTADERNRARTCPKCQKQTYVPEQSCWKCINPACDVDGVCG